VIDRRFATFTATLGFLQLAPRAPELQLLRRWSDSWRGVGDIVGGMRRLGYTTEFRQYPLGWRVNVRRAGVDPIVGSGWAVTPWAAVQEAAWQTLR
jgi:hypothetical protein